MTLHSFKFVKYILCALLLSTCYAEQHLFVSGMNHEGSSQCGCLRTVSSVNFDSSLSCTDILADSCASKADVEEDELEPTPVLHENTWNFLNCPSTVSLILSTVQSYIELLKQLPLMVAKSLSFKKLYIFVWPSLYGLFIVWFSWLLIYFDSKVPGVCPPSPISPTKHRTISGHSFHLSYSIGLINGIITFSLALWQQIFA